MSVTSQDCCLEIVRTRASVEVGEENRFLKDQDLNYERRTSFNLCFILANTGFDDKPGDERASFLAGYRQPEVITDASQHSKVKLIWDMEDDSTPTQPPRSYEREFLKSTTAIKVLARMAGVCRLEDIEIGPILPKFYYRRQ